MTNSPDTSDPEEQVVKISLPLQRAVHAALSKEASGLQREPTEHIQRILAEHCINNQLLEDSVAKRFKLSWTLVDQAVREAKRLCREGQFSSAITLEAIKTCTADERWAEGYRELVRDDIFKHGNRRKGPINRELGYRIRAGIGGKVAKDAHGRPMMEKVAGQIIQSFTLMEGFDPDLVATA